MEIDKVKWKNYFICADSIFVFKITFQKKRDWNGNLYHHDVVITSSIKHDQRAALDEAINIFKKHFWSYIPSGFDNESLFIKAIDVTTDRGYPFHGIYLKPMNPGFEQYDGCYYDYIDIGYILKQPVGKPKRVKQLDIFESSKETL